MHALLARQGLQLTGLYPHNHGMRTNNDMNDAYGNSFITGGAGPVGRDCAFPLTEEGYAVTLFDQSLPNEGRRQWETDLPCVKGDLT